MSVFNNAQPIYMQIIEQFYYQICSSEILPGEKLPSVRETAVQFGVNPNTVQRAYMEMERNGVIEAKRGQGSFVTEDLTLLRQLRANMAEERMNQFVNNMYELGFSAEEVLKQVTAILNNRSGEDSWNE
ncbi:GntR family transcriptional regulator [Caldalkalibacillus mannanilyticus]|uniref:GntR family transcriptional regulator n=1 Tax=Caldalkalibacillus mannanilyticus TaxID=1418 RepID=UPI000468696C|nr:GntR family transcriptional regulator [Caldalkalibacillus mannanilyticus]